MHSNAHSPRVVVAIASIQVLALALWAGGLVTLGAVVAPIVFHTVPAPTSADAMTLVFARFDRVMIVCGAIALVAEATLALRGGKVERMDVVRMVALVVAVALAITIAAWLTPGIASLHEGGAVRGSGAPGLELERLHKLAETLAKAELAFLLLVAVLSIGKVSRAARA